MNDVLATKRTDIMLVDPRNIVKNENNVRVDMGDIAELSQSIATIGLQVPLKAKKLRGEDKWTLVDGHRRFEAILLAIENGAEIQFVDVMPYKGNDEDQIFSMIATGTGQKQLTEIEQAEAIKRLVAFHYKPEEIAKKIGKSVPYIYNLLTVANAPKEIKDLVGEGLISGGTVVQIVKQTKNGDEQLKMVKDAIADAKASVGEGKAPKKATAKNVAKFKAVSPTQKLKDLVVALNESENDKAKFLIDLYLALKTESVEDLLKRFE